MEPWREELYHHGVPGQKWGIRRYQNPDGSLTPEGYEHYLNNLDRRARRSTIELVNNDIVAKVYTKKRDKALQKGQNRKAEKYTKIIDDSNRRSKAYKKVLKDTIAEVDDTINLLKKDGFKWLAYTTDYAINYPSTEADEVIKDVMHEYGRTKFSIFSGRLNQPLGNIFMVTDKKVTDHAGFNNSEKHVVNYQIVADTLEDHYLNDGNAYIPYDRTFKRYS